MSGEKWRSEYQGMDCFRFFSFKILLLIHMYVGIHLHRGAMAFFST